MPPDSSLRGVVAAVGALATVEGRLFEVVGSWVPGTVDDGLAVAFATVSRELGEHAVWWQEVLPESVLLDPGSALVLPVTWSAAIDDVAQLVGDAPRAAVLHLLLLPALAVACSAVPAGERFVRRVRDRVLSDLADAIVGSSAATARVCADTAAAGAVGAAIAGVAASLAST